MNILEHKGLLSVVGASLTAVSGACWGYVFASNELEKKFDAALEATLREEIDKTRRFYATRYKDVAVEDVSEFPEGFDPVREEHQVAIPMDQLSSPESRAAVMAQIQKEIEPDPEPEERPVEVNAFDQTPPDVDIDELIASRSADKPYIISKDEYLRNEAHYVSFDLTFFEGDGVLISEPDEHGKEEAIPDTDQTVGDKNLQMFGVMSGNNNTLYVQNDVSEALFCITRSFQTSSEALFGVKEEDDAIIQHSTMKRRRPSPGDE